MNRAASLEMEAGCGNVPFKREYKEKVLGCFWLDPVCQEDSRALDSTEYIYSDGIKNKYMINSSRNGAWTLINGLMQSTDL